MAASLQVYPAPEYAAAIKNRVWSLFEVPLSLKKCEQVLSEDGPFPISEPLSDSVPFVGICSKGWEGDRAEGGLPALQGGLVFVVSLLKQFAITLSEQAVAQALETDLRTIAKAFALDDWSLPGFSAPSGWRHRRIFPVRIQPVFDDGLKEFSTRLVGGEIELRATGDSFKAP